MNEIIEHQIDRKREAAVEKLKIIREKEALSNPKETSAIDTNTSVSQLWEVITLFQNYPFYTARNLRFTYTVKGNEIFVDRKEKSITRATVELAYQKILDGVVITGPKKLGCFGASYLYPMFIRFGVI